MKILAFDTTNTTLSVAILFDLELAAKKDVFESNLQAEMLIPSIEDCLKQADIWYQDLNLIAFTNGPGSFTGVRIGYSCAKALAIATKLPIIAFSSLEVVAYSYRLGCYEGQNFQKILVVNDAKLGELFIQEFAIENGEIRANFEPMIINLDEIKNFLPQEQFLLIGSAKLMIKEWAENAIICEREDFIDAKNIALLALKKYSPTNNKDSQALYPQALYIRKPKITARKATNIIKPFQN